MLRIPGRLASDCGLTYCVNIYEAWHLYNEIFVERQYPILDHLRGPSPLVLDVGANIGMFASFVLRAHPTARVVAVEPAPDTAQTLRANFADDPRVTVIETALGLESGERDFSYYPGCTFLSGFDIPPMSIFSISSQAVRTWFRDNGKSAERDSSALVHQVAQTRASNVTLLKVSTTSTGELIQSLGEHIDVMKVDVEGAEFDVLSGMAEDSWGQVGTFALEPDMIPAVRANTEALLRHQGFRMLSPPTTASGPPAFLAHNPRQPSS